MRQPRRTLQQMREKKEHERSGEREVARFEQHKQEQAEANHDAARPEAAIAPDGFRR